MSARANDLKIFVFWALLGDHLRNNTRDASPRCAPRGFLFCGVGKVFSQSVLTRLIASSKQHATQAVNTVLIDFLTRNDLFRMRQLFEIYRDDEKVAALLRPLRNITSNCLHEFYQMNMTDRGDAA